MTDTGFDKDIWKSLWTERKFDLVKEDGFDHFVSDDCDKHDDDTCNHDDCGDNTSWNVSIID